MDLKDFVKETVASIAEATTELQDELAEHGVIINPPRTDANNGDAFDPKATIKPKLTIIDVQFDVAVSASSETSGGGGAKLKVFSVGVDGKAEHAKSSEQISRINFKLPISLKPSSAEAEVADNYEKVREKQRAATQARRTSRRF